MKTLLNAEHLWYDSHKRKPILQIKILREISKHGRMSVSQAEKKLMVEGHYHPEIYQSFCILCDKGLIRKLNGVGNGKRLIVSRGRRMKYYCLTEEGIKAIFMEVAEPKLFWSALIGFCNHNETYCTHEKIEEFYRFFLNQFLKYPVAVDFGPILRYLSEACDDWIRENFDDKQSVLELILNTVAVSPNMTLEQLNAKTNIEHKKLNQVLVIYSLDSLDYSDAYYIDEDDYDKFLPEQFKDYIIHNLFSITFDAKHAKSYSLSLFGILLYLSILRRRTEGNSELYEKLFYELAQNYPEKLPLIFGKVSILKNVFYSLAAYNFDLILLDENSRSQIMDDSILFGDNKEYLQNMYSLSIFTHDKLVELYRGGFSANNEDVASKEEIYVDGIPVLKSKLEDLKTILTLNNPMHSLPDNYESLINEIGIARKQGIALPNLHMRRQRRQRNVLEAIEKVLATEISFVYYLNLNVDIFMPVGFGVPAGRINEERTKWLMSRIAMDELRNAKFLQEKLLIILNADFEIRDWFCPLIASSVRYQKEVLSSMEESPLIAANKKGL